MARANATRCCSPPESVVTLRSSSGVISITSATCPKVNIHPQSGWPITVEQISAHFQMRKQGEVLRDVADATETRWKIQSFSGIKDHLVVELHCSSERPTKTGYQIEKRVFPAPDGPKIPAIGRSNIASTPKRNQPAVAGYCEVAGSSGAFAHRDNLTAENSDEDDADRNEQERQCGSVVAELNVLINGQ